MTRFVHCSADGKDVFLGEIWKSPRLGSIEFQPGARSRRQERSTWKSFDMVLELFHSRGYWRIYSIIVFTEQNIFGLNEIIYLSGFQLAFTRVTYTGSHSQPMSPCLGSRHISHFSLSSGQFNKKYISGRNEQTNLDWTRFHEKRHYWIAKMLWCFFITADGVICPCQNRKCLLKEHFPSVENLW